MEIKIVLGALKIDVCCKKKKNYDYQKYIVYL